MSRWADLEQFAHGGNCSRSIPGVRVFKFCPRGTEFEHPVPRDRRVAPRHQAQHRHQLSPDIAPPGPLAEMGDHDPPAANSQSQFGGEYSPFSSPFLIRSPTLPSPLSWPPFELGGVGGTDPPSVMVARCPDERLRERPGHHQSRASPRGRGIKPTIVTHSALTSTCEKGTDLTEALRLL